MTRLLPILGVAFVVAALAACGGDDDTGGGDGPCRGVACDDGGGRDDATTPDAGDPDCTGDGDCDTGAVCTDGRCVPACVSDDDCGTGELCDAGRCVPGAPCTSADDCETGELCDACVGVCRQAAGTSCQQDANCGFDEFCDPCLSICRPRLDLCDPCGADAECGDADDLCLDFASGGRFCGRGCGACPVGYTCDPAVQQCLPLSGDCGRVRQCDTPADCPAGQTCSATFLCVEGCTDDASCPGGDVCSVGACVPPCTSDAECPDGATCDDGHCVRPGGCTSSADCTEPATFCDRTTFSCVPGCQTDIDCQNAAQECVDGACVAAGCRGNYSCAFGQVCDDATGACVAAEGPYCDPCDGQDVDSCGGDNAFVTFQDDAGADVGAFCLVACVEGAGDDACPQGYGCRELDVDGDVRRVCTRQCPRDPV